MNTVYWNDGCDCDVATNRVGAELVVCPYLIGLNTAVLVFIPPKFGQASKLTDWTPSVTHMWPLLGALWCI